MYNCTRNYINGEWVESTSENFHDIINQAKPRLRVISVPVGQHLGNDHAIAIDSKVHLLPSPLSSFAMLRRRPFAFSDNREPRAIDDEIKGPGALDEIQLNVDMLTSPGQSCVVGSFKREIHQLQQ